MTSALSLLKSSGTSEFKLWWKTSLGCEHLIPPWLYATSHMHTDAHAHAHALFIGVLFSRRLSSLGHDTRIIHLTAVNLQTSLTLTHHLYEGEH